MSKTKAQLEDELKEIRGKLRYSKKMEDHWYAKFEEALDELRAANDKVRRLEIREERLQEEHSQVVKQRDRMMQNIHDMDKRYHSLLQAFRDLATEVLTPRGLN